MDLAAGDPSSIAGHNRVVKRDGPVIKARNSAAVNTAVLVVEGVRSIPNDR